MHNRKRRFTSGQCLCQSVGAPLSHKRLCVRRLACLRDGGIKARAQAPTLCLHQLQLLQVHLRDQQLMRLSANF